MKFKWLTRKGIVVVREESNGEFAWGVSGDTPILSAHIPTWGMGTFLKKACEGIRRARASLKRDLVLQRAVEYSADCHAKKRSLRIYVERLPGGESFWKDVLIPLLLAAAIVGQVWLMGNIIEGDGMSTLPLSGLFFAAACSIALVHSGWVLGRAMKAGWRIYPTPRTVWKQHRGQIAGIVIMLVLGMGAIYFMPDQSGIEWAVNYYKSISDPVGAVAEVMGLHVVVLFLTGWEFIRGWIGSVHLSRSMEVSRQKFRTDHPKRALLWSIYFWRVDLLDFECPASCVSHTAVSFEGISTT